MPEVRSRVVTACTTGVTTRTIAIDWLTHPLYVAIRDTTPE
jgi:hypothetical protein